MAYSNTLREEELKNKVANDYFSSYDNTKIIGNIDFCIAKITDKSGGKQAELFNETQITQSLFWAEAKRGNKQDIYESFVQLIMTIGKAKTYEKHLPPVFLGAFDAEKIAFVQYNVVSEVFAQNDFDWTVTSSNHETKEFRQLYALVKDELERKSQLFYYDKDDKELKSFIKNNFVLGRVGVSKIIITKNNFVTVYFKWLQDVKPTIQIDWEKAKKQGIIDADFYLADLLSKDNESIKNSLFVLLKQNLYLMYRKDKDELGLQDATQVMFNDGQSAYRRFWSIYDRPPRKEFWNYIIERRDLLVPQDVRERKGSFFTPQKWVELSQKYLEDVLGENWQDEYYIWDCCAGTGNLLAGLTNKYNVWASTLDKADVDVMKDRIKNGANLLESHVFQMDFLNDDFADKCPEGLQEILNNPQKRKKLVIYINPPYAECGLVNNGNKNNKAGVSLNNNTYMKYTNCLGKASRELFAQFFIRIYKEINGCIIGEFSKLKMIQSSNFSKFRDIFMARLEKMFVVPAETFDNVKGQFPIGFMIWNTAEQEKIQDTETDVYDKMSTFIGKKKLFIESNIYLINNWIENTEHSDTEIGFINIKCNDFQHNNRIVIGYKNVLSNGDIHRILNKYNLLKYCIYFSVRHCIEANWLNDRDQFLYPNDGWKIDMEFQADCLAFTLFHGQNRISSEQGINHWIPFSEQEVDAKDVFASHFMSDYIKDKQIEFSAEAQAVFAAGKALWKYYHEQPQANPNASFYDIRAYFQGRDKNGKMNKDSADTQYMALIGSLRQAQKVLAAKIAEKVYKYGFLKG